MRMGTLVGNLRRLSEDHNIIFNIFHFNFQIKTPKAAKHYVDWGRHSRVLSEWYHITCHLTYEY